MVDEKRKKCHLCPVCEQHDAFIDLGTLIEITY